MLAKPQPIDDNYVKILRVESTGPAFRFLRIRLEFEARGAVYFPEGKAGNIFRGALGECLRDVACVPSCRNSQTCEWKQDCLYADLFEPQSEIGPSGYRDLPRPFVLRPHWQEERRVSVGERFFLDVHLFDRNPEVLNTLLLAFSRFGEKGLGPGRPRVRLVNATALDGMGNQRLDVMEGGRLETSGDAEISMDLNDEVGEGKTVDICFESPLSLKHNGGVLHEPQFSVFFRRLVERVCILDRSFGRGLVSVPIKNMQSAEPITFEVISGRIDSRRRTSGRTGQMQAIGGFIGSVRYRNITSGMLSWIEVGTWVGVGRQTVWGNGAFRLVQR